MEQLPVAPIGLEMPEQKTINLAYAENKGVEMAHSLARRRGGFTPKLDLKLKLKVVRTVLCCRLWESQV